MKTLELAVETFSETVRALGGKLTDRIVEKRGAYRRATLPGEEQVRPRDALKPGVALRANRSTIQVVPYVFRVVCSNGAIWVHSGAAFSLETGASTSDWEIEEFVRSSTETAASDEAFQGCLAEIRSGIAAPMRSASLVSTLLAARIPELASHLLEVALEETKVDSEIETRYDAMNAVTAAARQVRDPETKWKMEAYATTLLLGAAVDEPARPSWAAALVA